MYGQIQCGTPVIRAKPKGMPDLKSQRTLSRAFPRTFAGDIRVPWHILSVVTLGRLWWSVLTPRPQTMSV